MTEAEKLIRIEFLQRKIESYQTTCDHWAKATNGQQQVEHYETEIKRMHATIDAIKQGVPVMYRPSEFLPGMITIPYVIHDEVQVIENSSMPTKILVKGRYKEINGNLFLAGPNDADNE